MLYCHMLLSRNDLHFPFPPPFLFPYPLSSSLLSLLSYRRPGRRRAGGTEGGGRASHPADSSTEAGGTDIQFASPWARARVAPAGSSPPSSAVQVTTASINNGLRRVLGREAR